MLHWLPRVEEELGDENVNVILANERNSVLVLCSIHNVLSH